MIEAARTRAPMAGRRAWLVRCARLAASLCLAAVLPAHAAPAPNEVIGYAAADRSGGRASWTLGADQPYLLVPHVGGAVAAGVAAVDAGGEVGVALFQRPYFVGHDIGCLPALGSDDRPDLKWRGATARFVPPVEAPVEAPVAPTADQPAERYASLIIYRQDLGPPPGALLLDRRLTLVVNCGNAGHKTLFDRIFIPAAAPPEATRCFNLAGTYPHDGGVDTKLNFLAADRLVLLLPADLDDRYRRVRHRISAIAYDGDGCRGGSAEFRSEAAGARDDRLDQVGLRDRVRSVRIVYEAGALGPYMATPAAAPQLAATSAIPAPPVAADYAAPTGADKPAAAKPAAADAEATPRGRVQPPEPAPTPAAAAPPPLQLAMPGLRLKPPTPAADPAKQAFDYPVHEIYRLNYCLRWGADCGEPAATAWCQAQGFAKAESWTVDKNIGALFPTIVMTDKRVCAQFPCDGFQQITCSR